MMESPALRRTGCLWWTAALLTAIGCRDATPPSPGSTANSDADTAAPPAATTAAAEGTTGRPSLKFERKKTPRPDEDQPVRKVPQLVDVAEASGLTHTYSNGAAGQLLMIEATGGGAGWLDFDRDGAWDVYLNQGGNPTAPSPDERPPHQLFRNNGSGQFRPVTPHCGIAEHGYGQGAAIGDFDNDGFDDIYVTNVGGDELYQNCGDGTFRRVTPGSGLRQKTWSTTAAWGDIDRDGDLDLYVCTYAAYDPLHPRQCRNSRGTLAICHPNVMDPLPDECYLNQGDGTFLPIASERGLFGPGNMALGVAISDFNNDGWPDLFVANDTRANFLFINDGTAHFHESAAVLGCAVNINGSPQANMGVAVGDYDRNGWLDVFVTHYTGEWNTLYRNRGAEGFQDVSALVGLVPAKLDKLGFGTVMADLNYDGADELFIANGHVDPNRDEQFQFEMNCQLYTWQGRKWLEQTPAAGEFFERRLVGRAVGTADYDNDGDLDLVVVSQNSPVALLQNRSPLGHWLKLEFSGRHSNRRGIGTRVAVRFGNQTLVQELAGGTSYCTTHQPALFFGLGDWSSAVQLEIHWPSGTVQTLPDVTINQSLVILEPEPEQDQALPLTERRSS